MTTAPGFKIIRGGRLLDAPSHRWDAMDVLIEGTRIVEIGPPGLGAPQEVEEVDARDRLLIPGLVNAHTHGHGGLAKGAGDTWTLELLLNAGPWMSGNRAVEHKYLSTLLCALEMVSKGCTACYDLYLEIPVPTRDGFEAVGRAYTDAGMRAVVAPMVADHTFYQAIPGLMASLPQGLRREAEKMRLAPGEATVEACRRMFEHWPFDTSRLRPALAPTIPLHCSDEFIVANRNLARDYGLGLHMHLAESKIQAVSGMSHYGKTLTAHLQELDFLGPTFTAAHAIWLDADDIKRLADHGARVAHNPGSNMRLGSGLAPVREMLAAGVDVGVGTDGANCSDNQNMFEAMRFASFVSRVRSHDPEAWLSTREVFSLATEGSARVLGLGDDIGRIAPGYKADIVFLELDSINFIPLNDAVNQLVHSEDGSAVDGVMIDGDVVYWQKTFSHIDISRLRADVERAQSELAELNRDARDLAERLAEHVGHYCIGLGRKSYHVHAMAGVDY